MVDAIPAGWEIQKTVIDIMRRRGCVYTILRRSTYKY